MSKDLIQQRGTMISIATASLSGAVFAGAWDVWWHGFLGRESFWSPPHVLLYVSIITAVVIGFHAWRTYSHRAWKWLAITLLLVPLSAPFDELWHRLFGVEETTSILVLWSPPHLVLIGAVIGALACVLILLKQEHDRVKARFLGALSLASIFTLLSILAQPFEPLGPWHLLGFWGAGIMSLVIVFMFMFTHRYMIGFGRVTLVAIMCILFASINFVEVALINTNHTISHAHAPGWLIIASLLIPALYLDTRRVLTVWSGGVAGFISGGLIYGFATVFIDPAIQYGGVSVMSALIASTIGGMMGWYLSRYVARIKIFAH